MRPKFNKTKRNKALRQSPKRIKSQSWQGNEYFQVKNVDVLEGYKPRKGDREETVKIQDETIEEIVSRSNEYNWTEVDWQVPYGTEGDAYIIHSGEEQKGNVISGGVVVNKAMYDFIREVYPIADVLITEDAIAPVRFKFKNKIVAVLMPRRR